ncbi:hypothetical protein GCM10010412_093340 [Nonomuraea recticatena]|uniref:Uncharacterized protein n=1 Tax=Nonomuraea recticatena TaxID=46178 RepID=A0ABN3TA04_9ACTN
MSCGEESIVNLAGDCCAVHAVEEVAQCVVEGEEGSTGLLQDTGDMGPWCLGRQLDSSGCDKRVTRKDVRPE